MNPFYNNRPQISQSMNNQKNFRGPGTNVRAPSQVQQDTVSQSLPVTKESVKIWTGRVRKCLQDRPKGWLKTQVERSHERQYQERLPDKWAVDMEKMGEITMKREQGNVLVFLVAESTKSVNNNNMLMPSGAYPSEVEWSLTVTHVDSTSVVWVIFGDGRKKLDSLQTSLRVKHKSGTVFNGGSMPLGDYFSAHLTSGEVARTKVVKVDRMIHRCQVQLLDVGKIEDISWDRLVPLDKDFISLPPLAMQVIIAGVKESRDPDLINLASSRLLNSQFLGFSAGKGPNDIPIVSLFQGRIDVSEDLQRQLSKMKNDIKTGYCRTVGHNNTIQQSKVMNGGIGKVKSLSLPPAPVTEDFYDLRISHIVSPHEIYFQSYTSLPKYASMSRHMDSFYASDRDGLSECGAGMFVAVRYSGEWRRGKVVIEMVPLPGEDVDAKSFLVLLVDIGEHAVIKGDDIRELALVFSQLPVQVN